MLKSLLKSPGVIAAVATATATIAEFIQSAEAVAAGLGAALLLYLKENRARAEAAGNEYLEAQKRAIEAQQEWWTKANAHLEETLEDATDHLPGGYV